MPTNTRLRRTKHNPPKARQSKSKNIVICCDGTGNEYRAKNNTNIVKLFRILEKKHPHRQVVYYNPGVGTNSAPGVQTPIAKIVTKLLGLAFGYGLSGNIADAYLFLMRNYEPGDRIFLFGFSRGAYTVRALAGMLHFCGLLQKGSENLVPYSIKVFEQRKVKRPTWIKGRWSFLYFTIWIFLRFFRYTEPDFARAGGFKKIFSRVCDPYFIGVLDTVKAIGWLRRRIVLPFTANHPHLKYGRHAISIDEKRSQYRPNLWGYKNVANDRYDIQQVWFAGVHSDIGGSYPETGLSDITLDWMIRGATKHGLMVNSNELAHLELRPGANGKRHNPLLPFWWLLTWRRREIPNEAWIHDSVRKQQISASDQKKYDSRLPPDARYVS